MAEGMGAFAERIFQRTYALDEGETWFGCARRVADFVANGDRKWADRFYRAIADRAFMPGGRYLYASGRAIPAITNCMLLRAGDSREAWGDLLKIAVKSLSTGAGIGIEYSDVRPKGSPIKRFGGQASGPVSLMQMVNEVARHVMAGGKRRSALWGGLAWDHPDVAEFVAVKNWATDIRAMKERDFNAVAPLDMMNVSVGLDDGFFAAVESDKATRDLYLAVCRQMCRTGEPGFSVNLGARRRENLRNACTEVTSEDSGDSCNLGSVNFSRVKDLSELEDLARLGTRFLYLGTYVGWLPDEMFHEVRRKNRRLGLGIMGLHEWCLRRGLRYGPSEELGRWLAVWRDASDDEARRVAGEMGGAVPVATRALAPTGTIGICAETTTGIEPVYCVAYKRRFLGAGGRWQATYVVDPTAKRLVDEGVKPWEIEDSVGLARDVERRIAMQAFVQDHVDNAISSTINLPEWGEPGNNDHRAFAATLLRYLPRLRGITVYPDGARPGQPITPVAYEEAVARGDAVFEESEERCFGGSICGA